MKAKNYRIPLCWDPVPEKLETIFVSKAILQEKIDAIPDTYSLPLSLPANTTDAVVPIENIIGRVTDIDLDNAFVSADVQYSKVPLLEVFLDNGWCAGFQMTGTIDSHYEGDVLVKQLTSINRIIGLELIFPHEIDSQKEVV